MNSNVELEHLNLKKVLQMGL